MHAAEFADYHLPALETDAVRYNVLVSILADAAAETRPDLALWTLGAPGHCAVKTTGMPILLGALDEAECHRLAELTIDLDYPGVVGSGLTATWLVNRAAALGLAFAEPIPQGIHELRQPPRYPGAGGAARPVTKEDGEIFADWKLAFRLEATPHDPPPDREKLASRAGDGRFWFWVDGKPVSMAGIVRRTRTTGAI